MKTTNKNNRWILLAALFIWGCSGMSQKSEDEVIYYSVEIGGVICGYFESTSALINENENEWLQVSDEIILKLKALGQDVDVEIRNNYKIDPETNRYFYCHRYYTNGGAELVSTTTVDGDKALYSYDGEEPKELDISGGVILETALGQKYFMKDLLESNEKEKTYKVLDDMRGEIVDKNYSIKNKEVVELMGITYSTTIVEEMDLSSGTKITYWIEDSTGIAVKFMYSGRTISLSDASVKKKIQTVDYDNVLFAKVDKVITNVQDLTYMKVKAKINSAGEWITAESLNFPGQTFTGTVDENLIEGIFEIEPIRYDGANAPAFPFDYSLDEDMQKYLEPESLIESDHPDIIYEALKITKGATNFWSAAVSLSTWVAENIGGAIPGGTSAINTYNTRLGECGSHSRLLVAFCRALGIPARLSIGCMYTNHYGGSFGQHAWTEIFMGDAGWIAVDATAFEYDFVDAGHIRLGEWTSFQPDEMKILDYRIGDEAQVDNSIPEKYKDFVGKYTFIEKNRIIEIFYQEGSLAVNLPDKKVLALNDADENELYYPQISRQINFKFIRDTLGKVEDMRLQQILSFPRKAEQDSIPGDKSVEFDPYIGKYFLAQANIEMLVYFKDNDLCISDPMTKSDTRMEQNRNTGRWNLLSANSEIEFKKDENGDVNRLIYYQNVYLPKGEPVSIVLEEIINESGIEVAVEKYHELKETNDRNYIFYESALNNLGYKLLSNDKTTEAIEIYKLNVQAYPDSWNVYDSLGEAYMKNGDKKLAIKNYKKSVMLNPENTGGEENLAKLMDE